MKLAIVGFGLIGSSLARAAQRAYGASLNITAIDPSQDVLTYAQETGLCHQGSTSVLDIPKDCDWVILAAPVAASLALLDTVIKTVGPNTMLSDVGSTKALIVDALNHRHPKFERFIPAHPMAGREVSGPKHGLATLFDNKLVILTPARATVDAVTKAAESFYQKLGARTLRIDDASEHDRLMGYASHLPHLLAFAFVNLAARGNNGTTDYQDLTGGGYRDFTRIAASDPTMWRDIFLGNKDNIVAQLDAFSSILTTYREAILSDNDNSLTELMREAQSERLRLKQIIKGQDK
ncbi:MAG: prephenate dehydrogenase [Maricaulaceae bacterium]